MSRQYLPLKCLIYQGGSLTVFFREYMYMYMFCPSCIIYSYISFCAVYADISGAFIILCIIICLVYFIEQTPRSSSWLIFFLIWGIPPLPPTDNYASVSFIKWKNLRSIIINSFFFSLMFFSPPIRTECKKNK